MLLISVSIVIVFNAFESNERKVLRYNMGRVQLFSFEMWILRPSKYPERWIPSGYLT